MLVLVFRDSHANLERNFFLPGMTRTHSAKDMRETFEAVLGYLRELQPNKYKAGRKSQYVIPNALSRGAVIIQAESKAREHGASEPRGETEGAEAEAEDQAEELDVELTAEDLSVEDII